MARAFSKLQHQTSVNKYTHALRLVAARWWKRTASRVARGLWVWATRTRGVAAPDQIRQRRELRMQHAHRRSLRPQRNEGGRRLRLIKFGSHGNKEFLPLQPGAVIFSFSLVLAAVRGPDKIDKAKNHLFHPKGNAISLFGFLAIDQFQS